MDPYRNPFSPGAGSRPPEIAGREGVLHDARVALGRVLQRRSAQSQIFLGLRGTGKTVLLNEVRDRAEEGGYFVSFIEAPEDKSLAEMLYPLVRQALRRISTLEGARQSATVALRALRGFASVFKVNYEGFDLGVDPEPGTADSGELELDLADLFEAIGRAAPSTTDR